MDEQAELQQHAEARTRRQAATNDILNSKSHKIVVVAGPGTGKTTLFTEVLKRRDGDCVTLSFINALVDDLAVGLYGLSDVKTLHGFSTGILQKISKGARIYPKLHLVICEDAAVLLNRPNISFEKLFQTGEIDQDLLSFYKKRKDYYGRYYGFADSVYGLVKYWEQHEDKIPKFAQVLVDEFQDFNRMEVQLIDLLSKHSPVLIAGDDDQALYSAFRSASTDFIREKHADQEFKAFSLPYCSRSTRVIVEAVNDLLSSAKANGLCDARLDKEYLYFTCVEKDAASDSHPAIVYTQRFHGEIPPFIQQEIVRIAETDRKGFTVLIVGPAPRRASLTTIGRTLRTKGFKNIHYREKRSEIEPSLIEGLKILLKDDEDNLGWRIVAKKLLDETTYRAILNKTAVGQRVLDIVDKDFKKRIKRDLKVLRRIRDRKEDQLAPDELAASMTDLGYAAFDLAIDATRESIDDISGNSIIRAVRNTRIDVTTIPGSKGLAADYVFITHFDDQNFTNAKTGEVAEIDVFGLLVAMTRAKKKVFLISSKDQRPKILQWIGKDKIQSQFDAPHNKAAGG